MKIVLVHRDLHAITRGGICTLYRALAPRLAAAGHHLTLITQQTPHPLAMDGIRVVTLPRTEDMHTHRAAVTHVLNDLSPDLVEASSWEAEILHYTHRPPGQRAPVVVRGDLSAATIGADAALIDAEAELLALADRALAVSEFAADDLAAAYQMPRPLVVPNGIDRARFHPGPPTWPRSGSQVTLGPGGAPATSQPLTPANAPSPWTDPGRGRRRLVWVGKTTRMKGWDQLEQLVGALGDITHITVLLGHAPPLRPITVTGTEPALTILRDLSEDDVPSFYRAADWLISTSRWEGFGLAIGEALASGTPVLLPEHLGTAPELLAAGGGRTYRDLDELRTHLTAQPPAGVLPAVFDWDRNAATTVAVYQVTVAAHQAG